MDEYGRLTQMDSNKQTHTVCLSVCLSGGLGCKCTYIRTYLHAGYLTIVPSGGDGHVSLHLSLFKLHGEYLVYVNMLAFNGMEISMSIQLGSITFSHVHSFPHA